MKMNDIERVVRAFDDSAAWHRKFAATSASAVADAARVMAEALLSGRKILAFGNGGSATDAQHLAAELVGRFMRERRPAAAIALSADSAVVTCLGNDYGYNNVFARQIEALGQEGDVAIGITTSGRSVNVNLALHKAISFGLRTIAITGRDGGATAPLAETLLNVPAHDTARIQEVQRTIIHMLCDLVEARLPDSRA